ncbi:hypothetical protein J3A83DRAFT_4384645 [Scleroderma citrinum]
MHPALQIDEVLREIFGWIDGRKTLYALSRTCRTFSGPATDLIWETLTDLLPILLQLSCVKSQGCAWCPEVTFVRPLTPADWETFKRLSSRVRNLHLGQGKQSRCWYTSDYMFTFLLDSPYPASLFPSLRSLSLFDNPSIPQFRNLSEERRCALVRWFRGLIEVGPTVLDLHCDLVPLIVPDLPSIKSIRKLAISGDPFIYGREELTSVLYRTLPQLSLLESFSCDVESWDILWHLGHLPALKQLSMRLPRTPISSISPENGSVLFSELKSLDMREGAVQSIAELFRCTTFDKLTSLSATPVYNPDDAVGDSQVLDLIPSHFRQLQSIRLRHGMFRYTDLHKLDPYCNLQVLIIELHRSFGSTLLTDDGLVNMTHRLPHLERFYLLDKPDESGFGPRTGFTLLGLVNLVENCPKLTYLSLPFDARNNSQLVYMSSRKNGRVVRCDSVRYLNVIHSPTKSSKRLAKILSGLLPRLEVIAVDPGSEYTSWKAVARRHKNLPIFRRVDDVSKLSRGTDGMTLCSTEFLKTVDDGGWGSLDWWRAGDAGFL